MAQRKLLDKFAFEFMINWPKPFWLIAWLCFQVIAEEGGEDLEEEDPDEVERRRSKKNKKRRRKEESMTSSTAAIAGEGPSNAAPPVAGASEVEDPSKPKKKRGRPPIDKSLMPSKHVKKQMKKILEMVKHYTDR